LLYGWYPEAAAKYAKSKAALHDARRRRGEDEQDIEAGALFHFKDAAESCRQCAKRIGDLALVVARVFPDLWPQIRLVEVGARWHEESNLHWDVAVAELRRIEAVALASNDNHVITPSPDSLPNCARPPDELVDAARHTVPMILAPIHDTRSDPDAYRDGKGFM
jgi:hypothetical protein